MTHMNLNLISSSMNIGGGRTSNTTWRVSLMQINRFCEMRFRFSTGFKKQINQFSSSRFKQILGFHEILGFLNYMFNQFWLRFYDFVNE